MIGFHWSARYLVSSGTTLAESIGTTPGMIISDLSSLSHNTDITPAISRSTPRVRWNRSKVDQSWYSRSNSSGWIG